MMQMCSEYIGVWSTMNFASSSDNGHSCVMGNRNAQPIISEHSAEGLACEINKSMHRIDRSLETQRESQKMVTIQSNSNILSSTKQDQDFDCVQNLLSRAVATSCSDFSCHNSKFGSVMCSNSSNNKRAKDCLLQGHPHSPVSLGSDENISKLQEIFCSVHPGDMCNIYCNLCHIKVCNTCHTSEHEPRECKNSEDSLHFPVTSELVHSMDTNQGISSEKLLPLSELSQLPQDSVLKVVQLSSCIGECVEKPSPIAALSGAGRTIVHNVESSIAKCQFKAVKHYTLVKEDGNIVEGIFDGEYLVAEEISTIKNCIQTPSSLTLSSETVPSVNSACSPSLTPERKSEQLSSVLSGCRVKLDRLPSPDLIKVSKNTSKRMKLQCSNDMPANQSMKISGTSDNTGVHGNTTISSTKMLRKRRQLQFSCVPATVINIDHDDDEDVTAESSHVAKCSSNDFSVSSDQLEAIISSVENKNEDIGGKVLAEVHVDTAEFRGFSWHSLKVSFCQQRILLNKDLERLTVTVHDILSIKFDISSNLNTESTICIQVRPSFKAESFPARAALDCTSDLKLFLKILPSELDSLQTAIQILCSLLPETSEMPPFVASELECQPSCEIITADCTDLRKYCRAPLHNRAESLAKSHSLSSKALQALHEYDDCDLDSDVSDSIFISKSFSAEIVKLFVYPPPPAVGGITVTNQDLFCLNDGEFLNDVIIEFYLKYLQAEVLTYDQRARTHIFNTFFYGQLTKNSTNVSSGLSLQERRHSQVKRWTKHVDLFSKDFIIIPINEDSHWFLAIICFPSLVGSKLLSSGKELKPGSHFSTKRWSSHQSPQAVESSPMDSIDEDRKQPCILIFDSLKGSTSRWAVAVILREYLQIEWDLKKAQTDGSKKFEKSSMKGATPGCPQQSNSSDCGIYVLHYIENFFKRPLRDFTLPIRYLNDWFEHTEIATKRRELRSLIMTLLRNFNPSSNYNPALDGCDVC